MTIHKLATLKQWCAKSGLQTAQEFLWSLTTPNFVIDATQQVPEFNFILCNKKWLAWPVLALH